METGVREAVSLPGAHSPEAGDKDLWDQGAVAGGPLWEVYGLRASTRCSFSLSLRGQTCMAGGFPLTWSSPPHKSLAGLVSSLLGEAKTGSTRERRGQRVWGPRAESQVGKVVCHIFLKVRTLLRGSSYGFEVTLLKDPGWGRAEEFLASVPKFPR